MDNQTQQITKTRPLGIGELNEDEQKLVPPSRRHPSRNSVKTYFDNRAINVVCHGRDGKTQADSGERHGARLHCGGVACSEWLGCRPICHHARPCPLLLCASDLSSSRFSQVDEILENDRGKDVLGVESGCRKSLLLDREPCKDGRAEAHLSSTRCFNKTCQSTVVPTRLLGSATAHGR